MPPQTESAKQSLRYRYLEELEARVEAEKEDAGAALPEGQRLNSTLRRGWAFGGESFRERVLKMAGRAVGDARKRANYGAAPEVREHGERRAEQIVERGLQEVGLEDGDLAGLPRGDPRKGLIAHAVKNATVVPLDWIAERLEMGSRATVSRCAAEAAAKVARGGRNLRRSLAKILATENT